MQLQRKAESLNKEGHLSPTNIKASYGFGLTQMEVREVSPAEIWEEYKLLLGAAEGFAYKIPLPNSDKGINALTYAMAQDLNFIAIDKGEIVGALILVYDTLWWVDTVFLVDIAFYVDSEKRSTKAASMLINKGKAKAKTHAKKTGKRVVVTRKKSY